MVGSQTGQVRVVAQDPSVRDGVAGPILTGLVSFPAEETRDGPSGHRVQVIDYDSTTQTMYAPARMATATAERSDEDIVGDPAFHALNVYGLVMSTLGRFEFALGRRVAWGFPGHQLKVVPHAFAVANAFYSPDSQALLFGYFDRGDGTTFTCLSHDIVVHETAHALLDGLRGRFLKPSSPDQAAFHEGFADIVALLSVFSMKETVQRLIDHAARDTEDASTSEFVAMSALRPGQLMDSALFALAEEMAPGADPGGIGALRRSVRLRPNPNILDLLEFRDSHRRGEVLVAAMCRAFLEVWIRRLDALAPGSSKLVDRARAAEEGAGIADQLLTLAIRALDYTPPVHLLFGDFLSAALTADAEVRPNDDRYQLRATLLRCFASYGILPASGTADGCWRRSDKQLHRTGVRFGSVQSDPTEMFRLIWANRTRLKLPVTAYSWVSDVRPCLRIEPEDGLPVRETVATCIQHVKITADQLGQYGLRKPAGLAGEVEVSLEGGSTLVLDEYGMLKFEISNRLPRRTDTSARARAQTRLDYLHESGAFTEGNTFRNRFANVHRLRASAAASSRQEVW